MANRKANWYYLTRAKDIVSLSAAGRLADRVFDIMNAETNPNFVVRDLSDKSGIQNGHIALSIEETVEGGWREGMDAVIETVGMPDRVSVGLGIPGSGMKYMRDYFDSKGFRIRISRNPLDILYTIDGTRSVVAKKGYVESSG